MTESFLDFDFKVAFRVNGSDELVQNLWFSPGFGTESSVPTVPLTVPVPRIRFLLPDTRVSVQGFQRIICIFLIFVLVWFKFSTISVPNQVEPYALVLEP